LAGAFFAGAFFTAFFAAFFAGAFLAAFFAAFFTGAFLAAFFTGAFLAGAFLAGAFLAGAFLAGAFFTAAFLAGAFFTGAFFAGAFFAGAGAPGIACRALCIHARTAGHYPSQVTPFGHSRIKAYWPLPVTYRSLSRPSSLLNAKASINNSYLINRNSSKFKFFNVN
jgi:hypothetical protein